MLVALSLRGMGQEPSRCTCLDDSVYKMIWVDLAKYDLCVIELNACRGLVDYYQTMLDAREDIALYDTETIEMMQDKMLMLEAHSHQCAFVKEHLEREMEEKDKKHRVVTRVLGVLLITFIIL